ncbi:hypothetical protein [Streptomyces lunaelactis]|uniref:hypothetical protein n=1 Tax=Streptomyces lunaelactis TaxID=1535768 RepID=UPI0020C7FAE5|nr:hypothetical protein [Streptomyces lunaelactis]
MAFLVSCSLISLPAGTPAWVAATLLMTAVVIHTVGELWHSAAGFEVSFALGPGLLIALCITWGRPGWYVVGALFALTGLAAPLAVRWAQRRRHARQAPLEAALKESAA